MKRKLLGAISVLMMGLPFLTIAQSINKKNAYLDAIELALIQQAIDNARGEDLDLSHLVRQFNGILDKYSKDFNNPFLKKKEMISEVAKVEIGGKTDKIYKPKGIALYQKPEQSTGAAQSASWQAAAINGAANFMAGRFKQEMLNVGINQIFKQIKDNQVSEVVENIFPATYNQILMLYGNGENSYYSADLLYLRQLAIRDFEKLPENVVIAAPTIFPKMNANHRDVLKIAHQVYSFARKGQRVPSIFSSLANERYNNVTLSRVFNIADLVSNALLDTAGANNLWINPSALQVYSAHDLEKPLIRYFYALFYEQIKSEPFIKNQLKAFDKVTSEDNQIALANELQDLFEFVGKLNDAYNYVQSKDFRIKTTDEAIGYLDLIAQSVSGALSSKYISVLSDISNAELEVGNKYIVIVQVLMNKDYQQAVPLITSSLGEYMDKKYSRNLAFISQLAVVESAEDMSDLLESYALPIGSSSIKRKSSLNISVNGYVGLTAGREKAYGSGSNQTKTNIGLAAPIGISASWGKKNTWTVFTSIIDLGSVVNARLGNDTSAYNNFRIDQFLSPGIGLYYNLGNLPITFGFHYSFIPNLRTIQYKEGNAIVTDKNTSVTRANLSLLVDIPFFTLFNRER